MVLYRYSIGCQQLQLLAYRLVFASIPEPTRSKHFSSSTSTSMTGSAPFFYLFGEETGADISSPEPLPWHSNEMCLRTVLSVPSKRLCFQSLEKCLRREHLKQMILSLRMLERGVPARGIVHYKIKATRDGNLTSLTKISTSEESPQNHKSAQCHYTEEQPLLKIFWKSIFK